jgi:hypothetical protein
MASGTGCTSTRRATPARAARGHAGIARDVWNRHFAPVLGARDVVLLGIYSHMISSTLYLPDYPLGHLIEAQIEQHLEKKGRSGPSSSA